MSKSVVMSGGSVPAVGWDCYQQETPNESQNIVLLRVAHPQHPLNNKIVKALSQEAGHWIIEKPDGSSEQLLFAWAEAVPPIIAHTESPGSLDGGDRTAENLVTMIKKLHVQPLEEVCDDTRCRSAEENRRLAGDEIPGFSTNSGMGTVSDGEAERVATSSGRNVGQVDEGERGVRQTPFDCAQGRRSR